MKKVVSFAFVMLAMCSFGYVHAGTNPISGMRQYDGTYTGVSGTGGIGYSVLYRDNEDNGYTSGCNGEGCGKHPGIDILASSGSNVYAAFGGTVTISECNGNGWGGLIVIQSTNPHGSGNIYTAYAHLKQRNYSVNDSVSEGAVIGLSGGASGDSCAGTSTGAHLHFQIGKDSGYPWFPANVNQADTNNEVDQHAYHPTAMIQGFNYYSASNPYACLDEPTPDQNWYYSCTAESSFDSGDTIYGLLRLDNIKVDHRYKVVTYKNGNYQWEWTADWNDVGSGWNHGFFWVTMTGVLAGNWELRYYIDTGSGFSAYPVSKQYFSVYYSYPYVYDGNGYTCGNEPTHDANWWYSCTPQSTFSAGQTVWGLVHIDQIYVDHRFKVAVYKNGSLQWQYTYGWNYVGDGWYYAFFWPTQTNPAAGSWEFRISVEIAGGGTTQIKTLYFQVN